MRLLMLLKWYLRHGKKVKELTNFNETKFYIITEVSIFVSSDFKTFEIMTFSPIVILLDPPPPNAPLWPYCRLIAINYQSCVDWRWGYLGQVLN